MVPLQMNVKTAGFEGPLDLLLHLIKQMEIDIYDIPMAEITEQYLAYLHTMQILELDVASEYLVMAATLLAIKSEMLLPRYDEPESDGYSDADFQPDPREELVARLIEYRKYKEAAAELREREKERALMFTKPPADLSEFASEPVEFPGEQATIYDMLGAFHKLLRRRRLQTPLQTRLMREEIPVEIRMEEILKTLQKRKSPLPFEELFPESDRRMLIVTFLALLELLKQNAIFVTQVKNFDRIWVGIK